MYRTILTMIVLLFGLGWIGPVSGEECENPKLFRQAIADAQQEAQMEYTKASAQFGEENDTTRRAYDTLIAAERCPGSDCTVDKARLILDLARKAYYSGYIEAKKTFDQAKNSYYQDNDRDRINGMNLPQIQRKMNQYYILLIQLERCLSSSLSAWDLTTGNPKDVLSSGQENPVSEASGPGPIEGEAR